MPVPSPFSNIEDPSIRVTVIINGKPSSDEYGLKSVFVRHEVNKISYAELVMVGAADATSGAIPTTDSDEFNPGNKISITAGYGSSGETNIFSGLIIDHEVIVDNENLFSIKLLCKQQAVALTYHTAEAFFTNKKDSEVIAAIASKYGLPVLIEETEDVHEALFQQMETDWDFIKQRCKKNGLIINTHNDVISIAKPNLNTKPVLRIALGESIISFNATLSTEVPPVTVQASASSSKGQVKFTGNAALKTGDLIELEGVGKKFNGNVFVWAVTHTIDSGAWHTEVGFGLQQQLPVEKFTSNNTALPAISGLQLATVKNIVNDPQKQFRIQVTIASAAEQPVDVWALLVSFYATDGAGALFYPEIGDDVVVGFLSGNVDTPVILGSLYSKKNKPAIPAQDENNNVKTFTTRSKLQLLFNDEKKIIQINTPGQNAITINDDDKSIVIADQHTNSVTLNSSGIQLNSAKDIVLKATGNISLNATGKIDIESKQDVTVSGLNINNKAQIGFTGKGNATAELSASGQTTVKGAMVMIN